MVGSGRIDGAIGCQLSRLATSRLKGCDVSASGVNRTVLRIRRGIGAANSSMVMVSAVPCHRIALGPITSSFAAAVTAPRRRSVIDHKCCRSP